jgi:hypothetical protein
LNEETKDFLNILVDNARTYRFLKNAVSNGTLMCDFENQYDLIATVAWFPKNIEYIEREGLGSDFCKFISVEYFRSLCIECVVDPDLW